MKAHTSDLKNNIKEFGRELDSKITYELNGETIELGNEELNSITPHYKSALLKSTMKELEIDSNVEIPEGTIVNYQLGVKVGNSYEYLNYGNYIVYSIEKKEDTNSYAIKCYDKMLYAMKDYEAMEITYPITVRDFINAICNKIGLTFKNGNERFVNSNKQIPKELYLSTEGTSIGYTFRDVLDELAGVTASTICINEEDDELEIRYVNDVGTTETSVGSSLVINGDEAETQLFTIEGKTTQSSTPTYASPKELISVGFKNLYKPSLTNGTTAINKNCDAILDNDEFTFTATGADMLFGRVVASGTSYPNNSIPLMEVGEATAISINLTNTKFNKNYINYYDANLISLGYTRIDTYKGTVNVPSNAKYFTFRIGVGDSSNGDVYKTKVILTKSTVPVDYVPYGKYGILIRISASGNSKSFTYEANEPLSSIDNYHDTFTITKGIASITRKIGHVVLNGTETWIYDSANQRYWTGVIIDKVVTPADTSTKAEAMANIPLLTANQTIYTSGLSGISIHPLGRIYITADVYNNLATKNVDLQYLYVDTVTEDLGAVQSPSLFKSNSNNIQIINNPRTTITYIKKIEDIDEEYLKDVNVNFGEKFGPINTIILSRSSGSDKIAQSIPANIPDEDKIAIEISDNQIMNDNDRAGFIPEILNRLNGIEYYINDFTSTGICFYNLCDRYRINVFDTPYKCIMLNDEANITQGLEESIYTPQPEETETEYKHTSSDDRKINQTYIIAKKNEGTIEAVVQAVSGEDGLTQRVETVEVKQRATDVRIDVISTNIDETTGDVREVTTTTGFKFDAEGMTIEDSTSNFKALHRNDGTYYKEGDSIVGQYTKDGSKQKDLELFGVYYYGKNDFPDTPMFVAQLFTDGDGEEGFGHFYNRGD